MGPDSTWPRSLVTFPSRWTAPHPIDGVLMRVARLPLLLVVLAACFSIPVSAESNSNTNSAARSHYLNAPISFEANRGQADLAVAFVSHGAGYSLLLSRQQVTLSLNQTNDATSTIRTSFFNDTATTE